MSSRRTTTGARAARGLALLAALCGCAPERVYDAPRFAFLAGYRGADAGAPVLLGNAAWWNRFKDPLLDRLVALALEGNPTLAVARERVTEAQAERARIPAAGQITTEVGAQVQGTGNGDADGTGTAEIGLSLLFDPFGEKRAMRQGAAARAEIAEAEADAAQLLLLYNLVNAYVDLRYQQRLLELRRAELAGRRRTLALTEAQRAANAATRLEITRSEARVAEIEATLPGAEAGVTATANQIAVLAGRSPGALPLDLGRGPQPRPTLDPDVGIPADLLRNRPDIRVAERAYYAALADLDVARAQLYPRLSLTGAITLNAVEGGTRGSDYYFGPALTLPALPVGAGRAAVEARSSAARQAHGRWKAVVLNAILEVENALLDYGTASRSAVAAARAARLYAEARDLTQEVFRRGEATLGDLIAVEQEVEAAEATLIATQRDRSRSFVALNVRLGAGHAAPPQ